MKKVTKVFKDLMTPDDQAQSWYGWVTNQMSHAFLGALIASILGLWGILVALLLAIVKELSDFAKAAKLLDSLMDIAFWVLGSATVAFSEHKAMLMLTLLVIAFLLYLGIRPRIKRD